MGTYNTIFQTLDCPRCGATVDLDIELHFGNTAMMKTLSLGDRYHWIIGNKSAKNGGRPEQGNCEGEGYTECPSCKKDFWLKAIVEKDILVSIQVNNEKAPYIS